MSPRVAVPPLVAAVKRDIAAVARRVPGAGKTWQAELALALAKEIEARSADTLSARVSAAKELRETMAALQALAPAEAKVDRLDDLTARRSARKAVSA